MFRITEETPVNGDVSNRLMEGLQGQSLCAVSVSRAGVSLAHKDPQDPLNTFTTHDPIHGFPANTRRTLNLNMYKFQLVCFTLGIYIMYVRHTLYSFLSATLCATAKPYIVSTTLYLCRLYESHMCVGVMLEL
jgi:hypothetical protein